MNSQINEDEDGSVLKKRIESYKFLSWEEFKNAFNTRHIPTSKPIALEAFRSTYISKDVRLFYNSILAIAYMVPLVVIPISLFGYISKWHILWALFLWRFLIATCRNAHCYHVKKTAVHHEDFFQALNEMGAFKDTNRI